MYLKELDEKLYEIQRTFIKSIEKKIKKFYQNKCQVRRWRNQELLFFLTRFLKPNIVLETGVANGYSSKAILYAIKKNKKGSLFSSDFHISGLKILKSILVF